MKTKLSGLILAMATVGAQAYATSQNLPGQNLDVFFEKNSAQPVAGEILKLANWVVDMRFKFPIQESLYIGGLDETSERTPKILATERADHVKLLLAQLGLVKIPIDFRSSIYKPLDSNNPLENGKRVEIELSPGCLNNCCDGQ